ncbi:PLD nuclease N-terminal domain-containing protein [Hufsiella ginkgonis]|uniref:Cardiolipin synthase N-terminal domain-containing protein n=1 Tax=Hufsiella ginkgonis TaxID=2695274 RepID=A0A7K1XV57_9SPHI|nr:PLD nuclease N-terminal domain-containing protein [Hufsiella ginkgonis]MXV14864.1 hypothetical protein [Hufsiella ginkgonis]
MNPFLFLGLGMSESLIGIAIMALSIYCILDIIKSGMNSTNKLLWIIIILIAPFIGGILYLFVGRKSKGII